LLCEEEFKIPKGYSESVNRSTDNASAKRKRKNGSTNITHKTKDPVTRTPLKTGCELIVYVVNINAKSKMAGKMNGRG
jgi:hypothetical protein